MDNRLLHEIPVDWRLHKDKVSPDIQKEIAYSYILIEEYPDRIILEDKDNKVIGIINIPYGRYSRPQY